MCKSINIRLRLWSGNSFSDTASMAFFNTLINTWQKPPLSPFSLISVVVNWVLMLIFSFSNSCSSKSRQIINCSCTSNSVLAVPFRCNNSLILWTISPARIDCWCIFSSNWYCTEFVPIFFACSIIPPSLYCVMAAMGWLSSWAKPAPISPKIAALCMRSSCNALFFNWRSVLIKNSLFCLNLYSNQRW